MTQLRNLVGDLVERRLWPVALLLVVALAAVPVVLGGRGDDAVTPAGSPPATPATDEGTAQRAEITLDTSVTARRNRGGKLRNPFKGPKLPKAKTAPTAIKPVTPSVPATPPADPGGPTGPATPAVPDVPSVPDSGSGSGSGGTGKKPATKSTYHVNLRFGTTDNQKTIRDIPRLAPLPSVTSPFFVFLGVLDGGETAVFMVSSDAVTTPESACRPTAATCETVHLKADDTAWFDFTAPDGTVTQYQMDLLSIRRKKVTSEDAVQAAAARHSRVGAELLRDAAAHGSPAAAGARSYRYLPERGVLVRAKRKKGATSAAADAMVPGAAEAIRLAPRRLQPGIPVWHWDAGKAER